MLQLPNGDFMIIFVFLDLAYKKMEIGLHNLAQEYYDQNDNHLTFT